MLPPPMRGEHFQQPLPVQTRWPIQEPKDGGKATAPAPRVHPGPSQGGGSPAITARNFIQ